MKLQPIGPGEKEHELDLTEKKHLRSILMNHPMTHDVGKMAHASGVSPDVILAILVGYGTNVETAQILLAVVNEIQKTTYSVEDTQLAGVRAGWNR